MTRLQLFAKHLIYPGWDLAIRSRRKLAPYFLKGEIDTLDAGCGNAAISLTALNLGNRVLGISIDAAAIQRCREYAEYVKADKTKLEFLVENIYDLVSLQRRFDQIICFETLEHLRRDREVVELFGKLLNESGRLHLCVPFKHCPFNIQAGLSQEEDGGHVRVGYTYEELESLLEGAGIQPLHRVDVGGWGVIRATAIQRKFEVYLFDKCPTPLADVGRTVLFFCLQPLVKLGSVVSYPPWSIYVCGEKVSSDENLHR